MAKSSTSFGEKPQPTRRKPRGKAKKSLMLDAIREVCTNEQEFLKQMVVIGIGGLTKISGPDEKEEEFEYKNPNPMLLSLVLNRIEPPLKSVSPVYEFDFDSDGDLHKQAKQVLGAMASGALPSDIGELFITSISSMLNIQEKTDFEERLRAIEDASKQD